MFKTKEELLQRLTDIEWDDFECKAAENKLPEDVWETVSAFSNTSGGWVVFGIKQIGKKFEVQGVNNGEKTESDFLNTLRGGQNFNNPINTFIRTGSGDRRATETEVMAMMRDQAFGCKSELVVEGTSLKDLNKGSLETYRNHIRNDNPTFPYKDLPDDQFCEKVGISKEGKLTIGGILMLGQRDVVQLHINNFWIDYLEIPGKSLSEAKVRYTFRMQEQDNIWESYQIILQRLRNFVDAPYEAQPDGAGTENESQLYALREGLTNCCAHADYFSLFPLSELRTQIHSIPRNPNLIKFFRYAKLGENAGYGIDKMLAWERLTKGKVEFVSDFVSSTITYWFGEQASDQVSGTAGGTAGGTASGTVSEPVQLLINTIGEGVLGISELQNRLKIKSRRYIHESMLAPSIEGGYVLRSYPDKPSHPKQRYYLSEKGLKHVQS